ncbi:MAG: DinB family protein [Actinomycetota bacterium]
MSDRASPPPVTPTPTAAPSPPPPDLPHAGDERTLLLAFLDVYRFEFIDRMRGLDGDALRQRLTPGRLTLGALVGHMALVEHIWFRVRMAGLDMPEPYASFDFDADPDAEMAWGESLAAIELTAAFTAAVAESDRLIADAALDDLAATVPAGVEPWNLRWIVIHMIEEYARHTGHADLIRESIDGELARP